MISEVSRPKLSRKSKTTRIMLPQKKSETGTEKKQCSNIGLLIQGLYNKSICQGLVKPNRTKTGIDLKKLESLNIPNFALVYQNGIRGEALSSRKNRKYLKQMKKCGINTVIDLRDKYKSRSFPEMCKNSGLSYYNIPIDSSSVTDKDIIKNLPLLFNLIDNGNFYIACAQGLHRTDIALSLNYVFNPNSSEPPILRGHFRNGMLKFDDIARRLNSIKKNLTRDDLNNLGWDDSFERQFLLRKKELVRYNTEFCS